MSSSNLIMDFYYKNHIPVFIFLKIMVVTSIYLAAIFLFNDNWLFNYQDFTKVYSDCSQSFANIGFTKLICFVGVDNFSNWSPIIAFITKTLILIGYLSIFKQFLDKKSFLFISFLLIIHPYLAIHSIRFYNDIFSEIFIFLIFSFFVLNKRPNLLLVAALITLIYLRYLNGLIAICFFLPVLVFNYKNEKTKSLIYIFIILFFSMTIVLDNISYGVRGANLISDSGITGYLLNIINLFGARESVAINGMRGFFYEQLQTNIYGIIQILISLLIISIHLLGFFFMILNKGHPFNSKIIYLNFYLIIHIFTIAHMRYLLPLIPIYLFFFVYFLSNDSKAKITS